MGLSVCADLGGELAAAGVSGVWIGCYGCDSCLRTFYAVWRPETYPNLVLRVRSQFRCGVSRWVFGVGSQFPCEAPEGRDKVEGNLCSDPENACVSGIPFVLTLRQAQDRVREAYRRIGLSLRRAQDWVRKAYRSLALNQSSGSLMSADAALSRPRATHLFLLRQNKVNQKKATLVPALSAQIPAEEAASLSLNPVTAPTLPKSRPMAGPKYSKML